MFFSMLDNQNWYLGSYDFRSIEDAMVKSGLVKQAPSTEKIDIDGTTNVGFVFGPDSTVKKVAVVPSIGDFFLKDFTRANYTTPITANWNEIPGAISIITTYSYPLLYCSNQVSLGVNDINYYFPLNAEIAGNRCEQTGVLLEGGPVQSPPYQSYYVQSYTTALFYYPYYADPRVDLSVHLDENGDGIHDTGDSLESIHLAQVGVPVPYDDDDADGGDKSEGDDDTQTDDDTVVSADDDTAPCLDCYIESRCWEHGEHNPSNPCEYCDKNVSTADWTLEPDGATCDTGRWCIVGRTCLDGQCGVKRDCGDTNFCSGNYCDEVHNRCATYIPCPNDGDWCNGTEYCDETTQNCAAADIPCGDNETCDEETDTCAPAADDDTTDDDSSDDDSVDDDTSDDDTFLSDDDTNTGDDDTVALECLEVCSDQDQLELLLECNVWGFTEDLNVVAEECETACGREGSRAFEVIQCLSQTTSCETLWNCYWDVQPTACDAFCDNTSPDYMEIGYDCGVLDWPSVEAARQICQLSCAVGYTSAEYIACWEATVAIYGNECEGLDPATAMLTEEYDELVQCSGFSDDDTTDDDTTDDDTSDDDTTDDDTTDDDTTDDDMVDDDTTDDDTTDDDATDDDTTDDDTTDDDTVDDDTSDDDTADDDTTGDDDTCAEYCADVDKMEFVIQCGIGGESGLTDPTLAAMQLQCTDGCANPEAATWMQQLIACTPAAVPLPTAAECDAAYACLLPALQTHATCDAFCTSADPDYLLPIETCQFNRLSRARYECHDVCAADGLDDATIACWLDAMGDANECTLLPVCLEQTDDDTTDDDTVDDDTTDDDTSDDDTTDDDTTDDDTTDDDTSDDDTTDDDTTDDDTTDDDTMDDDTSDDDTAADDDTTEWTECIEFANNEAYVSVLIECGLVGDNGDVVPSVAEIQAMLLVMCASSDPDTLTMAQTLMTAVPLSGGDCVTLYENVFAGWQEEETCADFCDSTEPDYVGEVVTCNIGDQGTEQRARFACHWLCNADEMDPVVAACWEYVVENPPADDDTAPDDDTADDQCVELAACFDLAEGDDDTTDDDTGDDDTQ